MSEKADCKKRPTYTEALLAVKGELNGLSSVLRMHMSEQKAQTARYEKQFENIFIRLGVTEKQVSFYSGVLKGAGVLSVVLGGLWALVKIVG